MGLIESFPHVRDKILLMDLLRPTNKVPHLILQEEQRRPISQVKIDHIALMSESNHVMNGSTNGLHKHSNTKKEIDQLVDIVENRSYYRKRL